MVGCDYGSVFSPGHGALNLVAQLPNVAGPVADHQQVHGLRSNLNILATKLRRVVIDVIVHYRRDLAPAFTQRRDSQADDVEPVIQVLTKATLRDHLFQIAIGGGDDSHINLAGPLFTERLNFTFL